MGSFTLTRTLSVPLSFFSQKFPTGTISMESPQKLQDSGRTGASPELFSYAVNIFKIKKEKKKGKEGKQTKCLFQIGLELE